MSVNKVILVGHLGSDPEFRQSGEGAGVTRCSIATNKVWNDNQGQRQERTEWHRVVFFGRLAEVASQYLKKGAQIYVEGELRTSSWEKDGVKRYSTDIIGQEMRMLGGRRGESSSDQDSYSQDRANGGDNRSQSSGQAAPGKSAETPKPSNAGDKFEDPDEDIPF